MWSGLQRTNAYQRLNEEEKQEIELAILKTKGVDGRIKRSEGLSKTMVPLSLRNYRFVEIVIHLCNNR